MRKQEIMELHKLLVQLRVRDENLGLVKPGAFAEYDRLGVAPTHAHRAKGWHAAAVVLLARGLHASTGAKTPVFAIKREERL